MTAERRFDRTTRREIIYSAALEIARRKRVMELTYQTVADACKEPTKPATVRHYVKKLRNMQAETVRRAAKSGDPVYKAFLEDAKTYGFESGD